MCPCFVLFTKIRKLNNKHNNNTLQLQHILQQSLIHALMLIEYIVYVLSSIEHNIESRLYYEVA